MSAVDEVSTDYDQPLTDKYLKHAKIDGANK